MDGEGSSRVKAIEENRKLSIASFITKNFSSTETKLKSK